VGGVVTPHMRIRDAINPVAETSAPAFPEPQLPGLVSQRSTSGVAAAHVQFFICDTNKLGVSI
jgi:hypothetical protein